MVTGTYRKTLIAEVSFLAFGFLINEKLRYFVWGTLLKRNESKLKLVVLTSESEKIGARLSKCARFLSFNTCSCSGAPCRVFVICLNVRFLKDLSLFSTLPGLQLHL